MPISAPTLRQRKDRLAALRQRVARLERAQAGPAPAPLPLGAPEVERHLPGSGLACGVLHEVVAEDYGDRTAAFGFVTALAARALEHRGGPVLLIFSARALREIGSPYGHGLARLGLDLRRLVLVETRNTRDAFWAMEEALRSETAGITVVGAVERPPGLTASRRLNLAAAASGAPLVLFSSGAETGLETGASAAATRWRIAAAPAARDRFGAFSACRWEVALDRCRNGRVGRWLLEWSHDTHRFRLAEGMAGHAAPPRPGPPASILLRIAG